jgi:hypothetical protein
MSAQPSSPIDAGDGTVARGVPPRPTVDHGGTAADAVCTSPTESKTQYNKVQITYTNGGQTRRVQVSAESKQASVGPSIHQARSSSAPAPSASSADDTRAAARTPFFFAGADADADADADDAETGAAAAAWPVAPAVEFAEAEAEAEEDDDACEDGNATRTLGTADGAACATARDTAPAAALSSAPLR